MAISDDFLDRLVRHQVFLERFKTGEVNSILRFIQGDLLPDLRGRLTTRMERIRLRGFDRGPWTTKALGEVQKTLNGTIGTGMRFASDSVAESMAGFSIEESRYARALMSELMPINVVFNEAAPELLRAIVKTQPINGKSLSDWWKGIGKNAESASMAEIKKGLAFGESNDQILRRVFGTRANGFSGPLKVMRNQARSLVRTTVQHVAVQAREAVFEENSDVIKELQWVSTLDSRTTDICAGLDTQTFPLREGPRPPIHHQALVTGTLIETAHGPVPIERVRVGDRVLTHGGRFRPVYASMGRPLGGERVWRLETSSGRVVRATDEHPILTGRGWVHTEHLKPGDELFEHARELSQLPGRSGVPTEQRVLCDANDRPSHLDEPPIAQAVIATARGVSAAVQLERDDHPGSVGVLDAEEARGAFHGWLVTTLTTIDEDPYRGGVWNLAVEDDESFVAGGVVVHNCRSTMIPVTKSWDELGIKGIKEMKPGTRASMDGQVAARTSYGDWLKNQPVDVQNNVLGVGRAQLFRSGKVPITKFVDSRYNSLSLEDLMKIEGL